MVLHRAGACVENLSKCVCIALRGFCCFLNWQKPNFRITQDLFCEKCVSWFHSVDLNGLSLWGLSICKLNLLAHERTYQLNVRSPPLACTLTKTNHRSHITPILASVHWLPFKYRIDFKILSVAFKAQRGLAPHYISQLLTTSCNLRSPSPGEGNLYYQKRHLPPLPPNQICLESQNIFDTQLIKFYI